MFVNSGITAAYLGSNSASKIYLGSTLIWPTEKDYSQQYLTFKITQGGDINWSVETNTSMTRTISYSKDNGATWTPITSTIEGTTVSVNTGDVVLFKGTNSEYCDSYYASSFSGSTCEFEVEGNIMSLVYGDNFIGQTTLVSANTFGCLFQRCTGLTKANNLVLPATTLSKMCYAWLFLRCYSLTTTPELPATTLADSCYVYMFQNCSSLTTAPELPVTTLAYRCYSNMFSGCTSLTTAPELPATTLTESCYNGMFKGCTSLTTAPELPATALTGFCYWDMFEDCTSLNYIKCLAETGIDITSSTVRWLSGVASTGTFVKKSGITWPSGANGIPDNWTVEEV